MMSPPLESASPLRGLRVLIVEDEALIASLLEDFLLDLGCDVVGPAMHMTEAVELAREAAIDGATLDVNIVGEKVYPVADILTERGIPFAGVAEAVPPRVPGRHHDAVAIAAAPCDIKTGRRTSAPLQLSLVFRHPLGLQAKPSTHRSAGTSRRDARGSALTAGGQPIGELEAPIDGADRGH